MEKKASIVIPCYEEALNIKPLCSRIDQALRKADITYEILLIDDFSGKGTEDTKTEVQNLKANGFDKVHLIIRMPSEGKGLSSAVLYGLDKAMYDIMLVMDADLQHEPESIPDLLSPIFNGKADVVFGSRHVSGGDMKSFSFFRKVVSSGATLLAKGLTSQSDPMSGFFTFRRPVLKRAKENGLSPLGYKIGLELLIRSRTPVSRVKDVPIHFRDRIAGESKLSAKQYVLYVLHLMKLYWFMYKWVFIVACMLMLTLFMFFF